MDEAERKASEHMHFEVIRSLWREREQLLFVSRQELHDEIAERHGIPPRDPDDDPDDEDDEDEDDFEDEAADLVLIELAHRAIDTTLDSFAMSGPSEEAFQKISNDYEEPARHWRYKITRNGIIGYARREDLTEDESIAMQGELLWKADEARRQASALTRWMRKGAASGRLRSKS